MVSFIHRSSICLKVSSMQASADDDQLIDRPPDRPEYDLLYTIYRVSFWFPSWIGRLYVSRYRPCKLQLMMIKLIVHSIVLNAVFYMLDTGCLFGFIRPRVVYKFQGIVHASFS